MISIWRSTAERSIRSDSYWSSVRSDTNESTAWAAVSMSSNQAASRSGWSRSRGMDHPGAAQDRVSPKRVANPALFNDVDPPAKDRLQFGLNLRRVLEREPVPGREGE